jgi:hypothetical protein
MNVQQNLQRIPCSSFRNLFPPRCKRCLDFSWRLFPGILQRDDAHQAAGHTAFMMQVDLLVPSSRGTVQSVDITISVLHTVFSSQPLTLWRYSYATSVNPN